MLKNGRAVFYPIYKGTHERNDSVRTMGIPYTPIKYREDLIKWIKDFSRSIDYLESRTEIDTKKVAYWG
jgi:eukaryotic-like serine/threonine-protein kinase